MPPTMILNRFIEKAEKKKRIMGSKNLRIMAILHSTVKRLKRELAFNCIKNVNYNDRNSNTDKVDLDQANLKTCDIAYDIELLKKEIIYFCVQLSFRPFTTKS
ncbi:hypothetical protein CHS0354_020409, partial [Potamilus streckersoni]